MVLKLHLGDTVRLKKAHPCGSFQWEVERLGADIGWSVWGAVAGPCCAVLDWSNVCKS